MITRRHALGLFASAAALSTARLHAATASAQTLRLENRVLEVHGKAAKVFGITNASGASGLDLWQDEGFNVRVENRLDAATVIHWHGLTPPMAQDGTDMSQPLIAPQGAYDYAFDLARPGTNWMHSHHGLTEQQLLAAPLIVRDVADRGIDRQDVTILLHDFSFTPPEEILARLQQGGAHVGSGTAAMASGMMRQGMGSMAGMDHAAMGHSAATPPPTPAPAMQMDLNDVDFDAFLANDRDLTDPEVIRVERNGLVRLRIINAAASTNFWIDLGQVTGSLVAVDGMSVAPVRGRRFEIAMAQRMDIELRIPDGDRAYPVLAQREGDKARTGVILAVNDARIEKLSSEAERIVPPVLLDLERQLVAANPLADRAPDLRANVRLTGDMMAYTWGIDDLTFEQRKPIDVSRGQRVELTLQNETMMSHPMHLHGHHFQVVGLGRARLAGAVRDTVLVPPFESVTIAFDAENPGEWPLHCHNLYHRAVGMMTTLRYV